VCTCKAWATSSSSGTAHCRLTRRSKPLQPSARPARYVCFSVEMPEPEPLPASDLAVGIDVGLTTFGNLF